MRRIVLFYIEKNKKLLRFFISGSSATSVDIFLLFFLTEFIGLWYLYSSIFSFAGSFFVSFFLQKYWTFEDKRESLKTKQMLMYFIVAGFNLMINSLGIVFLVEYFEIYYLLAQLIMISLLGIASFLIYNLIIFKKAIIENQEDENNS